MRAARVHAYGPPESIVIEEVVDPQPGPGEALVAVEAASINYPDVLDPRQRVSGVGSAAVHAGQ